MSKQVTKSIRLTEEEARSLGDLVAAHAASESALMRQWVLRGMESFRIEQAVLAYQRDEVDLRDGAALAGIPVGAFIDELAERRVALLYDPESIQPEIDEVLAEFEELSRERSRQPKA